jgi:hypothetical protein
MIMKSEKPAPQQVQMIAPWSMRIAAFVSALSAALAAYTARSVYEGEQSRQAAERARFTHSTYMNYVEFRRSRGHTLACEAALANENKVTDEDLAAIQLYESGTVLKYDKTRHAGLAACVDKPEVKALFDLETWADAQRNQVMTAIDDKLAWSITTLDAALIGYLEGTGDKEIICKNFAGFLRVGHQQYGYGVFGRYIERLMSAKVNLIREENYPNVYRFTKDVSELSTGFTKEVDCGKLKEKYPPAPLFTVWQDSLVGLFHNLF